MVEGQMDHAVGIGRSVAQAVEVLEVAMKHLGTRRSQIFGAGLGACQPQHLMPCLNQLRNKRRTNEARRPGHKDTHDDVSLGPTMCGLSGK